MQRIARMRIDGVPVAPLSEPGPTLVRRHALLRDRELLAGIEGGRLDEAWRPLQGALRRRRSALGVDRVALLAARRRAVEALDGAERDRALERVGRHVGVA